MTKMNSMDNSRYRTMAVAIIVVSLLAVALGVILWSSPSGDADGEHEYSLTYQPNGAKKAGGGDAVAISAHYDGIISTEYNPEYWYDTLPVGTPGNLPAAGPDNTNWVGPMNDQAVTVRTILKVVVVDKNTYSVDFPQGFNVDHIVKTGKAETYIQNISISGSHIGFDATGNTREGETYDMEVYFSLAAGTVQTVFGGWIDPNTSKEYLPGDVIPSSVTVLNAKWITPDYYVQALKIASSGSDAEKWVNNGYTVPADSKYVPRDHLVIGKKTAGDASINIAGQVYQGIDDGDSYGTFTVSNKGTYNVTFGDGREGPSMFGSIYRISENVNMATSLPVGTYRSMDITPARALENAASGYKILITAKNSYTNAGDVIFDNVKIMAFTDAATPSHGNKGNGIYGGGHILIMGRGLEISENMQVFGGVDNKSATLTRVIGEKTMISKEGDPATVKIATCLIIHSGVYYNVGGGCEYGAVGSSTVTDLCTYMVLKGGMVIDSVYGASVYGVDRSGTRYEYCDSYVYVTGAFLTGDDYVDTQTGDKTGNIGSKRLRDNYSISNFSVLKDVSVLIGGTRQAVMEGATHVFITDHASVYDAAGAGRESTSSINYSNLEISGAAIVRHAVSGGVMNAITTQKQMVNHTRVVILDDCKIASVYGAGYDIWDSPSSSYTTMFGEGTTVDIVMAGGTVGNLYGGGYRGSIGSSANPDNLTITISISGGNVVESVYGGGSGGADKAKHVNSGGARYNDSAKGWADTSGYSKVYGNINLNITGGTIGDSVYGGGKSVPQIASYKGYNFNNVGNNKFVAQVVGNIKITVDGNAVISGSVYGGGKGVEWTYDLENDPPKTEQDRYVVTDTTKTPLMTAGGLIKVDWFTGSGNITFQKMNTNTILYNSRYDPSNDRAFMYTGSYLEYAKVSGNAEVYIKGGTVNGSIFGGGSFGVIAETSGKGGNTYVEVTGGKVKENVYAGGLGIDTIVAVSGKRIVNIDYEDVDTVTDIIEGSVYGGSSIGDDGDKTSFPQNESGYSGYAEKGEHDSIVVVNQSYIGNPEISQDSSLYGGGFMGKTFGNSYVYVGYQYLYKDAEHPDDPSKNDPFNGKVVSYKVQGEINKKIITVNSIYAGGNVTAQGGHEVANPYTKDLVMGYGNVSVNGNGANNGISINGSIMGSGNSCNTRWSSTVDIADIDNSSNEIKGIHRANTLNISQSKLYITSRNTLTDVAGAPKDLSLFEIDDLYLKFNSNITIAAPADYIYNYNSYSKDNKPTTLTSPSNSINFMTGSTFYIRDMRDADGDGVPELVYGSVSGYTTIQSLSQTGSGAYVIAEQISSYGGFVITKEGTYKEADFNVFPLSNQNLKCWFISGTQNKVLTMNLPYNNDSQSTIGATIDIMKMQSDTDLRYTGATLTSVSTDNYGNSFEFMRPGTETTDYEFGMIIGYKEQGDSTPNLMYAEKERYLDVVGNNQDGYHSEWVRGTYYSDDPNEKDGSLEPQTEGVYTKVPLAPVNMISSSKDAGSYKLNLLFTGKPENTTLYVGYLQINMQEVTVVSYESTDAEGHIITTTNTMVANNINIRVDLYVIGSGEVTEDSEYRVVLKADEDPETNLCSGYAEILIPTGFLMGKLMLKDVDNIKYLPEGESITISAFKNGDNTTGWMNMNDPVKWTYKGDNAENPTIGTMSGTMVATIRYSISNFSYPDLQEGQYPEVTLNFRTTLKDGMSVDSKVTVVIQKKDTRAVTFYDDLNHLSETLNFTYGSYIRADSWRDMGYNFIGWYLDSDFMNLFDYNTPITKDISLYARFSFIVTFDNMNGTSSKMYVAADKNGAMLNDKQLPKPTMPGYELKGWYKDENGIIPWDYAFDSITGDTTLYAKWTGVEVKINFFYWSGEDKWVQYGGTEHLSDMTEAELKNTITNVGTAQDPVYADRLGNIYNKTGSNPDVYTLASERLFSDTIDPVRIYKYQVTTEGSLLTYHYQVYNGTAFVNVVDTTLQNDIRNLNGFSFKSSTDGKYYKMIDLTHFRCVSDDSWSIKVVSLDDLDTEFSITYADGKITGYQVYKDESLFKKVGGDYSEYIGISENDGWIVSSEQACMYYKNGEGVRFYDSGSYLYYRGEYDASLVKVSINDQTLKDQFGNTYDDLNNPTYFITDDVAYKYLISSGQYQRNTGTVEVPVWVNCDDPGLKFTKAKSEDRFTHLTKIYVSDPGSYTMIYLDVPYYPTVRYGSSFSVEDPKQSTSENPEYALDYAQTKVQELIGTDKFIRWQVFPDNDPSGPTSYGIYTDTNLTSNMINLNDRTWGDGGLEINLYALTARVAISLNMDKNVNDASAKVAAPSSFLVYPMPTAMKDSGSYFETPAAYHPDYFTEKGTGSYANKYKMYTDDNGNYYYKIVAKTIPWSGSTAVEKFNFGTAYHIDFTSGSYQSTMPNLVLNDAHGSPLGGYTVTVSEKTWPYGNKTGPDGLYHIYVKMVVSGPSSTTGKIEGGGISFNVLVGDSIQESYLSNDGKTRYNYDSINSYYTMKDENYYEPCTYEGGDSDHYDYYEDRYGNIYRCQKGEDVYTSNTTRVVMKKLYDTDAVGIQYRIDATTGKFQVYDGIDDYLAEHGLTKKDSNFNTYSTRPEVIEGYEMGMDGDVYSSQLVTGENILFYYDKGISFEETRNGNEHTFILTGKTRDNTSVPGSLWPTVNGYGQLNYNLSELTHYIVPLSGKNIWIFQKSTALSQMPSDTEGLQIIMDHTTEPETPTKYTMWTVHKEFKDVDEDLYEEDLSMLLPQDGTDVIVAIYYAESGETIEFNEDGTVKSGTCELIVKYTVKTSSLKSEVDLDKMVERNQDHVPNGVTPFNPNYKDWSFDHRTNTLSGTVGSNVQFLGTTLKVSGIKDGTTDQDVPVGELDAFLSSHGLGNKTAGTPDTYSTTESIRERYAKDLDGNVYESSLNAGSSVSFYTYEGVKISQISKEGKNIVLSLKGKTSNNIFTVTESVAWKDINGYGFLDINLKGLDGMAGKTLKVYQKSTALSLLPAGTPGAQAEPRTKFTEFGESFVYNTITDAYAHDAHILIPQDGTDIIIEVYDITGSDVRQDSNLIVRYVIKTGSLKTEPNLNIMTEGYSITYETINPNYTDWSFNYGIRTISGTVGINTEFLGTTITIGTIIDGSTMMEPGWDDSDPVTGYFYKTDDTSTPDPRFYYRYVKIDDTHYRMIDWKEVPIELGPEDPDHNYTGQLGLGTQWKDYYDSDVKETGRYDMGLEKNYTSTLNNYGGSVEFYADKGVSFTETSRDQNNIVLTLTGETSNNSSIFGAPTASLTGYAFIDINLKDLEGMAGKTLIITQESTVMSLLPSRATNAEATTDKKTIVFESVAYDTLTDSYSSDIHIQIPQDGTDITVKIYEMIKEDDHLVATYTIKTTDLKTVVDLDILTAGYHTDNLSQKNPDYHDWTFVFGTKTLSGTVGINVEFLGVSIIAESIIDGSTGDAPADLKAFLSAHGLDEGSGPYSSSVKSPGRYDMGLDKKYESELTSGGKVDFYSDKDVSFVQTGTDNNFTLTLTGKAYNNTRLITTQIPAWEKINGYGFLDINLKGLTGMAGKDLIVYQKSTALSLLPDPTPGATKVGGTQYTELKTTVSYNSLTDTFAGDIHILIPQDGTNVTVKIYHTSEDAGNLIVQYTIITSGLETEIDLDLTAGHPAEPYDQINTDYIDWKSVKSGVVSTLSGAVKTNTKFIGRNVMIDHGINKESFKDQGFTEIGGSPILVGLTKVYSDLSDTIYTAKRTLIGDGIVMWMYFDNLGRPEYQAIWNPHTAGIGQWTYKDMTTGQPCEKRNDFYLVSTINGKTYVNFDDDKFSERDWYVAEVVIDPDTHRDQFQNHYNLDGQGEYVLDYSTVWVAERSYVNELVTSNPDVEIWDAYEVEGTKKIKSYTERILPITDAEEINRLINRFGVPSDTYKVKQINLEDVGSDSPRIIQYCFESQTKSDIYIFVTTKISVSSGYVIVEKEEYVNGKWTYYSVLNPMEPVPVYLAGESLNTYYYKDVYFNHYSTYDNKDYNCISGSDTYYEFTFKLNEATRNGYKLSGWHNTHVNTDDALYPTSGLYRTLKLFYHEIDNKIVISKEVLDATNNSGNKVIYVNIDYETYAAESKDYEYFTYDGKSLPRLDYPERMYGVEYLALWSPIEYTVAVADSPNGTLNAFKVNSDGSRTPITKSDTVKYGDRIELSYSPNGVYQFIKWDITGEYEVGDEYSSSTTLVIHGNCSISVNDIGERVVIVPIRFDAGILSEADRQNVTVKVRNTVTDVEYALQNVGHSGAEEFREYIPLNSSDSNEGYEVLIYYAGDPQPYKMKGTFRVDKDNDLTFAYEVISARIMDKINQKSTGPDYTEIDGVRLEPGSKIVSYEVDGRIVVSVTRYVGVMQSYLEEVYEGYIINNPYSNLPAVQITIAAGFDYIVYEGFPNIDSSGEEYFEINTEWNYHAGHSFEETVHTFDLNWTRTDKPADIIVKMTTNNSPKYDVAFVAVIDEQTRKIDTTSGDELTRDTQESHHLRDAINAADAKFTDPNDQLYIGAGKSIQGWYYDSAFTAPIQDVQGVLLDDNAIAKLEFYKLDGDYHIYAKVVDTIEMFPIGVDVQTQDTTGDGYTTITTPGQKLNLTKDTSDISKDIGFDIKESDGSYSSSIVASGRYQMGLDGNPYSMTIGVGAGMFYADNGVTFAQTARDGKNVSMKMTGITGNNTSITGSPWTGITGYGYFDLNLKPSGEVDPSLFEDLYVWVYQKSTALSIRTSLDLNEVSHRDIGGFTESIRSYSYDSYLKGGNYANDIHVLIPQDGNEIILAIYFVHAKYIGQADLDDYSEVINAINTDQGVVLIGAMDIDTSALKTEVDLVDLISQRKDHNVNNPSQLNPDYKDWVFTYSGPTLSGTVKTNVNYIGSGIGISGESFTELYVKSHGLDLGPVESRYSSSILSTGRYAMGLENKYTSDLGKAGSVSFYTDVDAKVSQIARDGNNITLDAVGITGNNSILLTAAPWTSINGYGFLDINLKGLTGMAGKDLIVYQKSTALSLLPSGTTGAHAVENTKFTELRTTVSYNSLSDTFAGDIHVLIPQDGTDVTIMIYHTSENAGNLIASFTVETTNLATEVVLMKLVNGHNPTGIMNPNYSDWTFNYASSALGGLPKANTTFLGSHITGPTNIYGGKYYSDNLAGFHIRDDGLYPSVAFDNPVTAYEILPEYKDGLMTSVTVVVMVTEPVLSYGDTKMTLRYDRNTVNFKVNMTIRDTSDPWYDYTARYGQTVTLPDVTRDGISLNGWTSSPRIAISGSMPYTYTVTAADSGTIYLTPQFDPSQFVTVTFVTPIGVYKDNEQHRITVNVAKDSDAGVFRDLSDTPELTDIGGFILKGYEGLSFNTRFTEDKTVTAEFQSTNHNFVFRPDVGENCEVSAVKDSSSNLLNVGSHNDLENHSEITITVYPGKGRALAIAETKEWAYIKVASGSAVGPLNSLHEEQYYYDQFGNCYSDAECTQLVYSIVWVYEGTEDKAHTIGYYTQYKIVGDQFYKQTKEASSDNWVPCDPIHMYYYKPKVVDTKDELISGDDGLFMMYCHDYDKQDTGFQLMVWQQFADISNPVKVSEDGRYQWTFFLDTCTDMTIHTTELSVNINFVINGNMISDADQLTVYSQDKEVIDGYRIGEGAVDRHLDLTYSDGRYYDQYGNCYRDAEGTKLIYSMVWVHENDYYKQYRITEGSVKTYEQNIGTATTGQGVNWTEVQSPGQEYYFILSSAYSGATGSDGHFTIGVHSDYTRVYKPAEYARGNNVPMYSNVYFGKTLVYENITYNNVRWYTDRACTKEFSFNESLNRYEYLAKDDITLYTTIGYVTVFFYNNMGEYERAFLCQKEDNMITLPSVKYRVDGHIFVGWGLIDTDKNVFTYAPESRFECNVSELRLYAYYLKGGVDETHPYSGRAYSMSIDLCGNTGEGTVEQFIDKTDPRLDYTVSYTVDGHTSTDIPTFVDFTDTTVYYNGEIANGTNLAVFSGSMNISITKIELFIIAPSKSKMYEEGVELSVSSADIQMIAATPDGTIPNPEDITAIVLDTEMPGYTDHLSEIGSVRTAASIYFEEGKEKNYIIHYVDGSLILYDKYSARYNNGGS